MNNKVIAAFGASILALSSACGWYVYQRSELNTMRANLEVLKQAKQADVFSFNPKSNVEAVKKLLIHLAEIDTPDIWVTDVSYDGRNSIIKYKARNDTAVTKYLATFYDKMPEIPFKVDEVSANERGSDAAVVNKQKAAQTPFVLAYIQSKLAEQIRKAPPKRTDVPKVELEYNYELTIKLQEE